MQKIKLTSYMLSLLFRILCWILPVLTAYFMLFHLEAMMKLLNLSAITALIPSEKIPAPSTFTLGHRFALLAVQLLPLSITVFIFNQLSKLFHLYERGDLFEEENIRLIRSIGISMLIGQGIELIYQPLMSFVLTIDNPIGERFVALALGTTNFSTLITACIILLSSWIVKEAQQIKSDAQLTI